MMPKKVVSGLLLCLMGVVLLGCNESEDAGKISLKNFDRIRPEMTVGDVEAILGEPTERGPLQQSGSATYSWREGKKEILVTFDLTGKVSTNGRQVVKYKFNLEQGTTQE